MTPEEKAAELSATRKTNARLNRRCQELESAIHGNRLWNMGWRDGAEISRQRIKDAEESAIIHYKTATRKEMRQLRERVAELEDTLLKGGY